MQKDRGCDPASQEAGTQVQALMEEYLRLKETLDGAELVDGLPRTGVIPSPLTELRQRVAEGMAPLVEGIARRYAGSWEAGGGEAVDDLVSEGYVGLLAAMD